MEKNKHIKKRKSNSPNRNGKSSVALYQSVKIKLIIPVVILSVIAVISSGVSIYNLRRVNKAGSEISSKYLVSVQLLGDIKESVQKMQKLGCSYLVSEDEEIMAGVAEEILDTRIILKDLMERTETTLENKELKKQFKQFEADYQIFVKTLDMATNIFYKGFSVYCPTTATVGGITLLSSSVDLFIEKGIWRNDFSR